MTKPRTHKNAIGVVTLDARIARVVVCGRWLCVEIMLLLGDAMSDPTHGAPGRAFDGLIRAIREDLGAQAGASLSLPPDVGDLIAPFVLRIWREMDAEDLARMAPQDFAGLRYVAGWAKEYQARKIPGGGPPS